MSRPSKVKVGHLTYTIEWTSEEDWPAEHSGDGGLTFNHSARILVRLGDKDASPQVHREILLHEIMHACWAVSMVCHTNWREVASDDVEETAIRFSSPVLLDVLRSNPTVARFLTEK